MRFQCRLFRPLRQGVFNGNPLRPRPISTFSIIRSRHDAAGAHVVDEYVLVPDVSARFFINPMTPIRVAADSARVRYRRIDRAGQDIDDASAALCPQMRQRLRVIRAKKNSERFRRHLPQFFGGIHSVGLRRPPECSP